MTEQTARDEAGPAQVLTHGPREASPDADVPATAEKERPGAAGTEGAPTPTQPHAGAAPGASPEPTPGAGAGADPDPASGADPDADPDTGADLDPGVGPDLDQGADPGPDPASRLTAWARFVRVRRGLVGVVAGSVLLAGAGGTLLYRAHELRTDPAAGNHALTDVEATTRVNGDVSSALAKVFSYTPGGTEATARSARSALSGRAARQYTRLFAQVEKNVRSQRVALTTQSVRVGTVSLRGSTAHLLVFLDQTARRGTKKPTTSAAQLSVTARLHDDVWQITDIKAR